MTNENDDIPGSNQQSNQNADNIQPARGLEDQQGFQFPLWGKIALLIAAVALMILGYIKSGSNSSDNLGPDPDQIGQENRQPVTDVTLIGADGTQKKQLSEYKGEVVLVTFWAQWCAPCLVELPAFAQLESKYRKKGFKVVTINVDELGEPRKLAQEFLQKRDFKFDNYFDESKAIAEEFGVEVLPANFVLDRKGLVAFSGFGANDWTTTETAEMLESLLAEQP